MEKKEWKMAESIVKQFKKTIESVDFIPPSVFDVWTLDVCKALEYEEIMTKEQTLKEVLDLIKKRVKKNEREYKDFWVDLQKNNIPDHTLLKRDNELFSRIGGDISEGSLADVEVVVFDDLKKEIKKLREE